MDPVCGEYRVFWANRLQDVLAEYESTLREIDGAVLASAYHRVMYPTTQWGSCACRN